MLISAVAMHDKENRRQPFAVAFRRESNIVHDQSSPDTFAAAGFFKPEYFVSMTSIAPTTTFVETFTGILFASFVSQTRIEPSFLKSPPSTTIGSTTMQSNVPASVSTRCLPKIRISRG